MNETDYLYNIESDRKRNGMDYKGKYFFLWIIMKFYFDFLFLKNIL